MLKKIEFWYLHGIWTLAMVKNAVKKKVITAEDYAAITGESLEVANEATNEAGNEAVNKE